MLRSSTCAVAAALTATLIMVGAVQATDGAKYPNWKGAWARWAPPNSARDPGNGGTGFTAGGQPSFDQTRPWGFGQQAPLTPEYQKVLEDSLADQRNGGEGNFFGHAVQCLPGGMPLNMIAFRPLEFVVTPETTYVLIGSDDHHRRIFTDGRDWPAEIEPTFAGYSIGKWVDQDGDGRYDVLEVETRGPFKGSRAYDASGLPLAFDNQSIFKERFYLDRTNPNTLHDVITAIENALTRPWTVDKTYKRNPNPKPQWIETYCTESNSQIKIGTENYYLRGDG